MSSLVKGQIIDMQGYTEDKLPIRYLGVALISTRLRSINCQVLYEKIVGRGKSLTTKFLFLSGQLQLHKSILFVIKN